jgi:hypothetical protein
LLYFGAVRNPAGKDRRWPRLTWALERVGREGFLLVVVTIEEAGDLR